MHADVVIIGGSIGGVMAARAAASHGLRVLLTEETAWIGGQLTSQAVPPDEHPFIESFGCTATYRAFRDAVRQTMKTRYPVKPYVHGLAHWNPGHASVSRLSAPPAIMLEVLEEMLRPYVESGHLTIMHHHRVVAARHDDKQVFELTLEHLGDNTSMTVTGTYYLDATDIGELLPLTGTAFVTGAESIADTGEPNALDQPLPDDMQPVTWVAAVGYDPQHSQSVKKPVSYDFFKSAIWPCDDTHVLSWYGPDSSTGKTKRFGMFDDEGAGLFPLWSYRRIIDPRDFEHGVFDHEVTLINWPQNDYIFGNIYGTDRDDHHREQARELTRSLVYWLQHEAPRPDGGKGYPGVYLRSDILGTDDGLAMAPYIRESRRIKALTRITEHDINAELIDHLPRHHDTVGIGCYHIDLHMTTETNRFFFARSWPFEIPLGAFIPMHMENVLPACKNIGTTHLTNGCFRLHPVEWNIGEVAGHLAAKAIEWQVTPRVIQADPIWLTRFQACLDQAGIERSWPADKVHVI